MSQNSDKVAIVTVHGTGDTAEGLSGQKWFQQGSRFSEQVQQHLRGNGVEAEIIPHLWSGANSAWDRERAANKLAALIRRLYNRYDTIHVVAHSHGGNVANDAAVLLKWGLRRDAKREKFDSLTTVGTPFFNVRTGWLQMLAGILFLVIAWSSLVIFPIMTIAILLMAAQGQFTEGAVETQLMLAAIYIAIVGPCVWFMFQISRQGVRRILRPRTRHGHQDLDPQHLARKRRSHRVPAARRGIAARTLQPWLDVPRLARRAISIGVLAVLAVALANPFLYSFGLLDLWDFNATVADEDVAGNIFAVTILSLLMAPAIFTAVYLAYRFLIGGAQEVVVRGPMNRYVGGILRGVAMGRDGDQLLCQVGPRSHTHRTQEQVLTGDCASRMQEGANGAAGRLIDKYRWALFSVGGDSSASLTSLTTDAMTWDSLIHTTYFDQPEVAQAVAQHILRTVRESAHAEAAERTPAPSPAPAAQPA